MPRKGERERNKGKKKTNKENRTKVTFHKNFTTYGLNNSATPSLHRGKEWSRVGRAVPAPPRD